MIRIACQTITWGPEKNRENTDQVLSEVRKAGFSGVEIGARHLDHSKSEYYKGLLEGNGLQLVALHVGGNFLDQASVAEQVQNIGKTIRFAESLGTGYIFISGSYIKGKTAEDYRREAQVYNKIGVLCKDSGLKLCYHNHDWEIWNGLEGMRLLLENTDQELVFLVPDVGWVTRGGADPVHFVEENYRRIEAVHFKEFTTDGGFTEIGKGIVNFRGVYDSIRDKGDIWVVTEQDQTTTTPLESAGMNYAYVKSLIK